MLRPSKEFDEYARAVREAAAEYYRCSPEQVFNHRFEPSTKARQVVMAVMRLTTGTSYPLLGWLYGKHHTAIMNAEKAAEPDGVAYVLDHIKHLPKPAAWRRINPTRTKEFRRRKKELQSASWLIAAKCPRCGYMGAGRDDHDPKLLFCPKCDHDWYPPRRKKDEVYAAPVEGRGGCDFETALPVNGDASANHVPTSLV